MSFSKIDLEQEFSKVKSKEGVNGLMEEIYQQLKQEYEADKAVEERIFASNATLPNVLPSDLDQIFREDQIRDICIKYRLRFLDTSVFKSNIPTEAISKVKDLEQKWGVELKRFKIVAPQSLFDLEDPDADPLLFAQLTDNRYYLIHKWGGELNAFRSLLAFPLRSFMHLFWTLLGLALLFSALVPTPTLGLKLFLWIHSFIAFCALACVYVLGMRQNFSSESWNSKFI
ncbi:MAG: hypothetical protein WD530_04015 [Vicingaceae bacterium]